MEIKINNDFKGCLPALTPEEYAKLEASIVKEGVMNPIILWQSYIVDGHNRYQICQDHKIKEYPITSMNFKNKEQAIEWILQNQLGRRNLTDFQRNKIALQYEEVIAKRMRERMKLSEGRGKKKGGPTEHTFSQPTTKRKELAKIAGTSEGSIRRTQIILNKGTPEQIDRAEKGGKGNGLSTIAKEITGQMAKIKRCKKCGKELPEDDFYPGKNTCKDCFRLYQPIRDSSGKVVRATGEYKDISDAEIVGDLYNEGKVIKRDIKRTIEDFMVNFETYLDALEQIFIRDIEIIKNEESNRQLQETMAKAVESLNSMKERYAYAKLREESALYEN